MKSFFLTLILLVFTFFSLNAQSETELSGSCGLPPFPEEGTKAVYNAGYRDWKTGETMNVYFKNGTDLQRKKVEHYFRSWECYGNFDLIFHDGIKPEDSKGVHVEFTELDFGVSGKAHVGAASYSSSISMWLDPDSGVDLDTVTHEFGHSLGFSHEQENPAGKYLWKKDEAYEYFKTQYEMSRMEVDAQIFNNEDPSYDNWGEFDPWSTMGYIFPGRLFENGRPLGQSFGLSFGDREGVKAAYPGRENEYHFPVLLYKDREDVQLYASMASGEMDIYLNDNLYKTVSFDDIPELYVQWFHNKVTVQIAREVQKNKFTKIYYVHRPGKGEPEAQLTISSAGDYFVHMGSWAMPEALPLSDGSYLSNALYLAGIDDSNTTGPAYYEGLNDYYEALNIDYSQVYKADEEHPVALGEVSLPAEPAPAAEAPTPAAITSPVYKVDAAMKRQRFYFFNGPSFREYDGDNLKPLTSEPLQIDQRIWPGVTFDRIDAVLDWDENLAYFFSGNQYIRFNKAENRADTGYPKKISDRTWSGLPFSTIDAAVSFNNGKAYFFRGDQYVRYDLRSDRADSGYPKPINYRTWPGLSFEKIDAAVNGDTGKVFFFSGDEYIRYDIGRDEADSGYPRKIAENWPGLEFPDE